LGPPTRERFGIGAIAIALLKCAMDMVLGDELSNDVSH
jgi:hypothetical protein